MNRSFRSAIDGLNLYERIFSTWPQLSLNELKLKIDRARLSSAGLLPRRASQKHRHGLNHRNSGLVAVDHVLSDALKTDQRIPDQRKAPEPAVVLAQGVSGKHSRRTLHSGNCIGSANRRMSAIQIG